jgi:ribulose-phosphate 3-epimerase
VLPKIRECRRKIDDAGLSALLQIDGGVNPATAFELAEAGVDVFVAGSAVFNGDYAKNIENIKASMDRGGKSKS